MGKYVPEDEPGGRLVYREEHDDYLEETLDRADTERKGEP